MIEYDNKQFVIKLITTCQGSVFPTAFFPAFFSSMMCLVLTERSEDSTLSTNVLPNVPMPTIDHPFAVQIFGLILGYVIVFRTNMALSRYREGMANMQQMTSKWSDAYMQLKAFVCAEQCTCTPERARKLGSFLSKSLHWFSLMDAVAMCNLAEYPNEISNYSHTEVVGRRFSALSPETVAERWTIKKKMDTENEVNKEHEERAGKPKPQLERQKRERIVTPVATKKPFRIVDKLTIEEEDALLSAPDPLLIVCAWITEEVTIMHVTGLKIPGPILSRFYQEVSNGMLGFNQALKLIIVTFPFPFAQLLTYFLTIFLIVCPVMIVQMTKGNVLPVVLCFFATFSYWSLNLIATELEIPFGDDPNDLPYHDIHNRFVDSLEEQFRAQPRPVNRRIKAKEPVDYCAGTTALNDFLKEQQIPQRFSGKVPLLLVRDLTEEDLLRKFGDEATARVVHGRIRELWDELAVKLSLWDGKKQMPEPEEPAPPDDEEEESEDDEQNPDAQAIFKDGLLTRPLREKTMTAKKQAKEADSDTGEDDEEDEHAMNPGIPMQTST
jgi:predicted membrane chloride channel (bestrophin family)